MSSRFVRHAAAAAVAALGATALLAPARAVEAQNVTPRAAGHLFELTPYAGYMKFGNLVDGPLGTSITTAAGPIYGAQLGVNLTKNVTLIGNVARASDPGPSAEVKAATSRARVATCRSGCRSSAATRSAAARPGCTTAACS